MVEFYQPGESWLHRADPRVKLALTAVSMVLLLVWWHPIALLAAVVGQLGLYRSAGLPLARILWVGRGVLPVSLALGGLRAVFYPAGAVLFGWGPLQITEGGLVQGAVLGGRLVGMALAIFLWLFTTEGQAIVRGFVKLGIPYPWGLSIGLALRFIPTIRESYSTIARAQRARGLDLEGGRGLRRVRDLLPGLVALVVSTLRASEALARALEARAYGGAGRHRTYLRDIAFRSLDWGLLLSIGLGAALALWLTGRAGLAAVPTRFLP